jgi:hypothetical protein
MVEQCPFLLEVLAWINNTFPFQQHLKATCDLLPPLARACLLPFEQLIKQQMVHLQDSILECLHHHTFPSMFFDRIFEDHHAYILSCSNLGVGTWLIAWPIFPTFQLSSPSFSTTPWMRFKLPHLSIACLPWCVCTHRIDPMGIHLLCCAHGNEHTKTHYATHDIFIVIARDVGFHMGQK